MCVCICVFDIDPAEQQDTYSAVSGKKLVSVFAVNYCNSSVSVSLKQNFAQPFLSDLFRKSSLRLLMLDFIFLFVLHHWRNNGNKLQLRPVNVEIILLGFT